MIVVDLDELGHGDDSDATEGLIVRLPTGVHWHRQAGGGCCAQPRAEGLFIPLPVADAFDWAYRLRPDWCLGRRSDDAALLDRIDADLARAGLPLVASRRYAGDEVPGEHCPESGEAWLAVRVIGGRGKPAPRFARTDLLIAFAGRDAILTWPNSD